MKFAFIFICQIITLSCFALQKRNYVNYYNNILQIEELIGDEKFYEALKIYKSLFNSYEFIYSRDTYNAFQIACIIKDTAWHSYVFQCAKAGVPKSNLLTYSNIDSLPNLVSSQIDSIYKIGRTIYLSRINQSLRSEFQNRFKLEQAHKGLPDYKEICYNNFNRILELAKDNRFPGEQLIGADEELENNIVFATLLHYPYSYKILDEYIQEGILSGNIQPLCALYLYGFNQTRTSVLYTYRIQNDTVNFKPCYNLPFGKMSTNIELVNKNRKAKYISSTLVHNKLDNVAKKYHFEYKLGY